MFSQFSRDCGIDFNNLFPLMRTVFKFLQAPNPTGKLSIPVLLIVSFYSDYNSEISSGSVFRN